MKEAKQMHHADIHAALIKNGSSQTQIAKQEGCVNSFVSMVIRGERTGYKVACAISAATNIPLNKLWPGKYVEAPEHRKAS